MRRPLLALLLLVPALAFAKGKTGVTSPNAPVAPLPFANAPYESTHADVKPEELMKRFDGFKAQHEVLMKTKGWYTVPGVNREDLLVDGSMPDWYWEWGPVVPLMSGMAPTKTDRGIAVRENSPASEPWVQERIRSSYKVMSEGGQVVAVAFWETELVVERGTSQSKSQWLVRFDQGKIKDAWVQQSWNGGDPTEKLMTPEYDASGKMVAWVQESLQRPSEGWEGSAGRARYAVNAGAGLNNPF